MATISNTPRPGYVWDSTDNCWYPIGVGNHNHSEIQKTIVDAKGDLIVGTANDTVARQAVGTDGQTLIADSTQTNGVKWGDSPQSLLTTTGDLLYASAANTPARLAAGTSGYALTANGAGVAPSWQAVPTGSMTLISTTTISNNAQVSLTSIPQTYNSLRLVLRNVKPATDNVSLWMRFNNDSTASRYRNNGYANTTQPLTFATAQMSVVSSNDNAVANGLTIIDIHDYTNTTTWKVANIFSLGTDGTTTTSLQASYSGGIYNQTGAISEVDFLADTGNLTSGTILLYGVK